MDPALQMIMDQKYCRNSMGDLWKDTSVPTTLYIMSDSSTTRYTPEAMSRHGATTVTPAQPANGPKSGAGT